MINLCGESVIEQQRVTLCCFLTLTLTLTQALTHPCVQVSVDQLAPTSVTEYAWRVKYAMKPPKDAMKYSENATVKSEVEVRRQGGVPQPSGLRSVSALRPAAVA